jgi:hypothetical protein
MFLTVSFGMALKPDNNTIIMADLAKVRELLLLRQETSCFIFATFNQSHDLSDSDNNFLLNKPSKCAHASGEQFRQRQSHI